MRQTMSDHDWIVGEQVVGKADGPDATLTLAVVAGASGDTIRLVWSPHEADTAITVTLAIA